MLKDLTLAAKSSMSDAVTCLHKAAVCTFVDHGMNKSYWQILERMVECSTTCAELLQTTESEPSIALLGLGLDIQKELLAWQELGAGQEERLQHHDAEWHIDAMMQLIARWSKNTASEEQKEHISDCLTNLQATWTDAVAARAAAAQGSLREVTQELESLSGCGVDGTEWKADLSAEAPFEQVAEVAMKSILKSDPDKIKAAAVAVIEVQTRADGHSRM